MKKEHKTDIRYPSEYQINMQINQILDKGFHEKQPYFKRIRELFIGPGLPVIFYHAKLILMGSFFLYLLLVELCRYLGSFVSQEEYFAIVSFPMMHLIFHMLCYWNEEQDVTIELKESLHYSFQYVVSLRIFYVSILSAILNLLLTGSFTTFQQIGKVSMVGLSSLFLFALLTLVLCEKRSSRQPILIVSGLWICLCVVLSLYGSYISFLLFDVIPFAVHLLMFVISFGLFIYYFGKVGKKYAYTCKCY